MKVLTVPATFCFTAEVGFFPSTFFENFSPGFSFLADWDLVPDVAPASLDESFKGVTGELQLEVIRREWTSGFSAA
jgi:hypothetical protein